MTEPRRRQPALLRRKLLDAAAHLAVSEGLAAVTVAAVSRGAGVTKGGFFHHFPDKDALIAGLFSDQLTQFDAVIDALIALDPEPQGAFSRAYIRASLDPDLAHNAPLNAVLLMNPGMRGLWSDWLRARLNRHGQSETGSGAQIARHAADGIWLADLWQVDADLRQSHADLLACLLPLTLPPEPAQPPASRPKKDHPQ